MDITPLLKIMANKKASDLFITTGIAPSIKINGRITALSDTHLTPEETRQTVLQVMNDDQREYFNQNKECNFAISATGIGRFRVSAFIQRNFAGMVLRRIETVIPSIEELNLPPIIKSLALVKRGLVIFSGATGVGKSTSLASLVDYRNHNSTGHIVSIEDPIEFLHQHAGCIVTQREVGIDTDSYAVALKNTLRQAPDVILIGEVRTREVMNHAIEFTETGHLCLTTLHANNAYQTLDRMINFFPEDRRDQLLMDLSLNLKAIIAQQLIPSIDGKSRRVVVEVLLNTPLAAEFIRKGEIYKLKDLMKQSTQQGMKTFDQALFELYQAKEITQEDAIHYADSANEVRLMIKLGKGYPDEELDEMDGVSLMEDEEITQRF